MFQTLQIGFFAPGLPAEICAIIAHYVMQYDGTSADMALEL
eukprot:SAG31_NODE_4496_length_3186_cov_4.245222_2_plen_41_part_00